MSHFSSMFTKATRLGVSSIQRDNNEFLLDNKLFSKERLYFKFIPKVK